MSWAGLIHFAIHSIFLPPFCPLGLSYHQLILLLILRYCIGVMPKLSLKFL